MKRQEVDIGKWGSQDRTRLGKLSDVSAGLFGPIFWSKITPKLWTGEFTVNVWVDAELWSRDIEESGIFLSWSQILWVGSMRKAWVGTLRKEHIKRLEAFEIWMFQRRKRVGCMEHMTNEEILQIVEEKRSLIGVIRSRQRNWLVHIRRRQFVGAAADFY